MFLFCAENTWLVFCRAQANFLYILRICSKAVMRFQVVYMGKMTKVSWYCRLFQILGFKALVYSWHSFIVSWESTSIHQNTAGVSSKARYLTFNLPIKCCWCTVFRAARLADKEPFSSSTVCNYCIPVRSKQSSPCPAHAAVQIAQSKFSKENSA